MADNVELFRGSLAILRERVQPTKDNLALKANGGRLICTSSISASKGFVNHSVYGGSKGAIEAFARNLAVDLGSRGITVNAMSGDKPLTLLRRYRFANASTLPEPLKRKGNIHSNFWMAGVSFQDLFFPSAVAGVAAGQPFIDNAVGNSTQTNIEAFYNLPINDHIRVTPLVQVIVHPANQNDNGTIVTGTLRSIFYF